MSDKSKAPATESLPIPPGLQSKLEDFRSRLWSVKIAEGALAGVVGLGISYLFVFALDRFVDTPVWLRWAILAVGVAVPALGLPLRWHHWVWKQRSLEQVARLLRQKYPRLGDQLLGIVELARQQTTTGNGESSTLVAAAMNQVDEKIRDKNFDDAVPQNHYGKWLAATVTILAIGALAMALVSDAAKNALGRWVTPWKQIDRYTFAKIEPVPRRIIVPYAEDFNLGTKLREDTEWKPADASIRLPGKTKLTTEKVDDSYAFDLPPQKEEGSLALRIGDIREEIVVEPVSRPELTDLSATVQLPDYLRYEEDSIIPVRGGSVAIVKGAIASFKAETSRDLTSALANGKPAPVEGAAFSTAPAKITYSQTHEFTWEDIHGLRAKSPLELRINAVDDGAPDIFAKKLGSEDVILENEVISFDISASDDFGVRRVGLEWEGMRDPSGETDTSAGEKLIADGAPQNRDIEGRGTFSAAREGISPQTIQVRAFAEDYLPNRERTYSPTFVLHIMSPTDHAKWLTDEFGKWFRHAREVYEREQQLYEGNREIRQLSPSDLDRPENRRKIEKQASAESNNARRLDSLTNSGRNLIRQATKNDDFDAERLESWATMMRSLDDIAEKRMPSVADLLKKASQAAGGAQNGQKPDSKNQPNDQPPPAGGGSGDKPKEGEKQKGSPKGGKPSAPSVKVDHGDKPKASPPGKDQNGDKPPVPPVPGISDKESSMLKDAEKKEGETDKPPAPPKKGRLTLPQTTLKGVPGDKKEEEKAETPAQEKLDEAITEQEGLLEEFAKVADQLQEILSSLEASTFVKRLKAASREQMKVAKNLNTTLVGGFGMSKDQIAQQLREVAEETAVVYEEESTKVYNIQTDMDAYFQRKQDVVFKNVLDQMKNLSAVTNIKQIGDEVTVNLNGRSISAAEYWSDTLDRWAEELVSASECKECKGGSKDSLPPEIVLKIMKVLREEMELREETREMNAVRTALSGDEYESRVKPLELSQMDMRSRIDEAILEIMDLPEASENFGNELKLLNAVSDVMRQARAVLSRPDTGPEAIAAETEAIELLLQAKRQNPKGGGGGGSSPGGGGTASGAASLTDIGQGAAGEGESNPLARDVDQSTGKTGREFPEEFRNGLDKYFNALESAP